MSNEESQMIVEDEPDKNNNVHTRPLNRKINIKKKKNN